MNRHVAVTLTKHPSTAIGSKRRSHAADPVTSPGNAELLEVHSDEERFHSPTNKGKKVWRGAHPKKTLPMETGHTLQPEKTSKTTVPVVDSDTDTDAQASPPAPFTDPSTKYRHHLSDNTKLLKLPG